MLDLAIVGAGVMGSIHARVAMGLRDARVAVVVDPDRERARKVAELAGAKHTTDTADIVGRVDAAILAVPNDLHRSLGLTLMQDGISVLIEKPLASNLEEAEELINAARVHDVTLMVGHTERFNPAILEIERLLSDPIHIGITRVSPYSERVTDGVLLDLMIHDVDIVRALIASPVLHIDAVAAHVHSETEDLASVLLTFANGATASLLASRVGQTKIRRIEITQRDNFISGDLIQQTVLITRAFEGSFKSSGSYRQAGIVEIPFMEFRGEPLYLELEHFVKCILEGIPPKVSGSDALETLRLISRIQERAKRAS